MSKPVLALILAAVALAGAATAQTQARQTVSNQPIFFGADDGGVTPGGFALRGRAEVIQGENRLRANSIEIAQNGGTTTGATASGDVYYVTPNESIRGDRAVYSVSAATVTVTGDVILTQGRNVLTGGRLVYNIDTGEAQMAGAPRGGGAGNRIQGVFYPTQD
ncbi:LPS ABC transporter substrate-binding protein LptA [Brevundimonas sp. S30B]|uniref:LptA/OstA family protein n=1 Tax=unclassified Brevundimonas TaxID=2622653 RepID=UPI0010720F74|nr:MULTISPECIES: LptA/OstA family protein [unclassified Brevundimonas]QBX36573.1 LPS ABC transporter substrate-binding protein LptA [Brevundimonas sp. MF30-B]TFW00873.1 LPS ABC transporter substrate-binding protein LptA [Brevundimonas sp. S30B]